MQHFIEKISELLHTEIVEFEQLGGGEISKTYRLRSKDNRQFFFKFLESSDSKDMYEKEAKALLYISENTIFKTPKVYEVITMAESSGLLLEWIDRKIANPQEMETFGIQLADMHQINSNEFGWETSNYIGNLPQSNKKHETWADFYIEQRLEPLLKKCIDSSIFEHAMMGKIPSLYHHIENEIPEEKPALIHGDLWGGNYIISAESTPVLIDPAIHFGHREMDLAMSLLFGSFGRVFYEAYQSIFPLEKGFESRLPLLQLYPLLVHAYFFQGQYIGKVESIISRL